MTIPLAAQRADVGSRIGSGAPSQPSAGDTQEFVAASTPNQGLENDREAAIWSRLRLRHFTAAGNGVGLAVTTGATSVAITFRRQEPNVNYGVTVTPSWNTTVFVAAADKAVTGFTARFGTAPSGSPGTISFTTYRSEDS